MSNSSSSLADLPRTQKLLHIFFSLDFLSWRCYKFIIKVLTLSVKRLLFTLQNVKWVVPFGTRHRKFREEWSLIQNAIKVSIVPDKSIHFIFWLQAIWNRMSIENIPNEELCPREWSTIPEASCQWHSEWLESLLIICRVGSSVSKSFKVLFAYLRHNRLSKYKRTSISCPYSHSHPGPWYLNPEDIASAKIVSLIATSTESPSFFVDFWEGFVLS